jgi:hypothetical protein
MVVCAIIHGILNNKERTKAMYRRLQQTETMSNYRKQRFIVETEQIIVDGCGNKTTPITEGMVRGVVNNLPTLRSVNVGELPRYIWMVTVDGTTNGEYQHNAQAKLFPDRDAALKYVNDELMDLVVQGPLMGTKFTDDDLQQELIDHTEWDGDDDVHYHDCDTEMDYGISAVEVPKMA